MNKLKFAPVLLESASESDFSSSFKQCSLRELSHGVMGSMLWRFQDFNQEARKLVGKANYITFSLLS